MTFRVIVTGRAKADLRSAYLWAAERAPETAAKWSARFEAELATLANTPRRCGLAPEDQLVPSEIRQLTFGRRASAYRAHFTIADDVVLLLHVRRAARDLATADDLAVE